MTAIALRNNLSIQKAPAERGGGPGWLLHDPVAGRFYKLGEEQVAYLRHLSGHSRAGFDEENPEYKKFIQFLAENALIKCQDNEQRHTLQALVRAQAAKRSFKAMLAQYLSLRVPLFPCDGFLTRLLRFIRPFLGWQLIAFLGLLVISGVYMTVNQWGRFSHTFVEMVSLSGLLYFAVALMFVKVIHELAHGLVAKYYGCYVPTMGVTLLVFWPVLYTDTSTAWLLPSYRQRFMIGVAGMAAEIAVAFLALFLWHFMPPGGLRSVCFLLATTTWILSLLVNLNPLMRFDGYFLLSDWWRTDNLMPRSLALAKWYFRRAVWGIESEPNEQPQMRMVVYGACCWLYRVVLVFGISLIVYQLVYKPLGLLLMLSLIYKSILIPTTKELKFLMESRKMIIKPVRPFITVGLLLVLLAFVLLPFRHSVTMPAVLGPGNIQHVYAPLSGQVSYLAMPGQIASGALLYDLAVPDIEHKLATFRQEQEHLQWQLTQHSIGGEYLNPRPRIKSELIAVSEKYRQLGTVVSQKRFSAPFSGSFNPGSHWLKKGDWVEEGKLLGTLADTSYTRVTGYLSELDLSLISEAGSQPLQGSFYPDNGIDEPLPVWLESVDSVAVSRLGHPELASVFGGAIGVTEHRDGTLEPSISYFQLRFSSEVASGNRQIPGVIVLKGRSYSVMGQVWKRVVAIFRKEADI